KLPLIKKAKLREVISARGLIGNLDRKNAEFIFPTGLKGVNKPYLECSVGIENIFKVVRIDYIWRVTQFGSKPTDNWSIKAKFYFSF
ncbi:MAG: carboxypeptidase-like regulatory domain-containing protein, partial [Bacteroidia bacterium]|nr:carboxypeptidase-like regulatory domain-containing protein [Bacteroidia bacterium]